MRYVAGILYGLAAAGSGGLLDHIATFGLVALGTTCALFAVEAIVVEALTPRDLSTEDREAFEARLDQVQRHRPRGFTPGD